MRHRNPAQPWAGWVLPVLPLVFLLVVLVAPALRLLVEGGRGEAGLATLFAPWLDPYLRWRMAWSFWQATITCIASLILGLPMAWVLARFDFPGRTLILRGLMLPFVVPTLVAAMPTGPSTRRCTALA